MSLDGLIRCLIDSVNEEGGITCWPGCNRPLSPSSYSRPLSVAPRVPCAIGGIKGYRAGLQERGGEREEEEWGRERGDKEGTWPVSLENINKWDDETPKVNLFAEKSRKHPEKANSNRFVNSVSEASAIVVGASHENRPRKAQVSHVMENANGVERNRTGCNSAQSGPSISLTYGCICIHHTRAMRRMEQWGRGKSQIVWCFAPRKKNRK